MTDPERQLSELVQRAAGEPPHVLDADAGSAGAPSRRRRAAPAAAVVAVAAVAATIAFATGVTRSGRPATQPATTSPSNPRAIAEARIEEAMRAAPLPSGARRAAHGLPGASSVTTSGSPDEVRRTTWWTAPGGLTAAADFVRRHRPAGMSVESTGRAVGRNGSVTSLQFDFTTKPAAGGYGLNLDYALAPYRSGVAIRVDTWTVWAPSRPKWSYAPTDADSVAVTIVRRSLIKGTDPLGAPTIRRTLTGAEAHRLAAAVNAVTSVAPEGVHSCPPPLLDATDTVVVRTAVGDLVFSKTGAGCSPNTAVTDSQHPRPTTFIDGATFEAAVLKALGLPKDYGYRR